ncbi:unnamed protein product [Mytilus coruscus]|uniref:Apple domain-containing protein n=1 Tax=Mytilus coruscus TaxID=42192 RepID=A0A6J8ARJ6_MYTCO|nr:unnamed protein product [Mytilus coruscus]
MEIIPYMYIHLTVMSSLFLLSKVSSQQHTSGLFRIQPDKRNTRLHGFVYLTFEQMSPRLCFDKCIRRPKCYSYNYNRYILRCELNVRPKDDDTVDFKSEDRYIYVEIDWYRRDPTYDTCIENLCQEGETCESLLKGRNICVKDGDRLRDLDISVGNSLDNMIVCVHYDGPGSDGEHHVFNLEKEIIGRYVKLQIISTAEYLQLTEVRVFGYPTEANFWKVKIRNGKTEIQLSSCDGRRETEIQLSSCDGRRETEIQLSSCGGRRETEIQLSSCDGRRETEIQLSSCGGRRETNYQNQRRQTYKCELLHKNLLRHSIFP